MSDDFVWALSPLTMPNFYGLVAGVRPRLEADAASLEAAREYLRDQITRFYDTTRPGQESARDAAILQAQERFQRTYDGQLQRVQRDRRFRDSGADAQQAEALARAVRDWNNQILYGYSDRGAETRPVPYGSLDGTQSSFVEGRDDPRGQPVSLNDVNQEGFGDCYVMAGMGAVAHQNPELIRNMITENRGADGRIESYTVRLYRADASGPPRPVSVTVDAAFPTGTDRRAETGDRQGRTRETWPLVIEKAYAQERGSYDAIGPDQRSSACSAADVLSMMTGQRSESFTTAQYNATQDLERDLAAGKAIVLATGPNAAQGVIPEHAYVVKEVRTDRDGQREVVLYNPHGPNASVAPVPYQELASRFAQVTIGDTRPPAAAAAATPAP